MTARVGSMVALVAGAGVLLGGARTGAVGVPQDTRTIYVSVTNLGNGMPVQGVTAGELVVQEDNQVREITDVKLAAGPIAAVLMVDTTPAMRDVLNDFRAGMNSFVNDILTFSPESKVALGELAGAGIIGHPLSSDKASLLAYVPKLAPKVNVGLVVAEGVLEAAKHLETVEISRKLIVTINLEPADEQTTMPMQRVADEVRKSGAVLWGISVQKPGKLDRHAGRNAMLDQLARFTGGLHPGVSTGPSIEGVLRVAAANMLAQYAVTIARPAGTKPAQQTTVAIKREGVRASTVVWSPVR